MFGLLVLLLLLVFFLLLSFWFNTKKGKVCLSSATERSPPHFLQHCDGRRIDAEHKADAAGFLLALIDCPLVGIQSPVQPMESLNIALHIFHGAQKQIHHSFIGRKCLQAHCFEPRALPFFKGWYLTTQPIPGLLVLTTKMAAPFTQ